MITVSRSQSLPDIGIFHHETIGHCGVGNGRHHCRIVALFFCWGKREEGSLWLTVKTPTAKSGATTKSGRVEKKTKGHQTHPADRADHQPLPPVPGIT